LQPVYQEIESSISFRLSNPENISSENRSSFSYEALQQAPAAGTGATGPDEDVCKRSLLVCLDAVHHIAKAPIIPDFRFISRSICALIAKQVLRTGHQEEAELRWLQEVTGETSNTIFNASIGIATQDRINFKSFVYAVLSSSNQAGDLPTDPFKETLAILLDVRVGGTATAHLLDRIAGTRMWVHVTS
jgi:hypothetical protein